MKLDCLRISTIALLTLFLFSAFGSATAEFQFEVETITIKVYRDGLTHITQTLIVDDLLPEIDLPLLSASVENLIVLDENQLAVDYQQNAANLTVFTLGASRVSVEYDTIALTNKEADVWTIILNHPYNLTVSLPQNSTIVYLSQVPTTIDTTGTELSLALHPGQWELSYIVPLLLEDPNKDTPSTGIPVEYLIAVAIAAVATVLIVLFVARHKRGINVKKILSRHSDLVKEDVAVIEFLAEKDGKAFEAEIRERFPDMPRTSLWRLVRRLEGLDLVEIKRIGLENQVQLKK
jgi:uncharacterized membrane protein